MAHLVDADAVVSCGDTYDNSNVANKVANVLFIYFLIGANF